VSLGRSDVRKVLSGGDDLAREQQSLGAGFYNDYTGKAMLRKFKRKILGSSCILGGEAALAFPLTTWEEADNAVSWNHA
jgi:hypothetical protein